MEPILIASIAALIYGSISWLTGDLFPFSRYAMYADLGQRKEGAVLYVRADGREVGFDEVVDWVGITPEALSPFGVPCSLQWVVFEAQRWIEQHPGQKDERSVVVEVGFRIVKVDGRRVEERLEPRATGWGRLRRGPDRRSGVGGGGARGGAPEKGQAEK